MKRPLVWLALAFVLGELSAWAGLPGTGLAAAIAIFMTAAGIRFGFGKIRSLLVPAVFLLSGFALFCRVGSLPVENERLLSSGSVTACGRISRISEGEKSTAITLTEAYLSADGSPVRAGLVIYGESGLDGFLHIGDEILCEGRIRRPEQAKNPGQFDAASYQLARGVHYAMFPEHLELTKKRSSVRGILQDLRRHLKAILRRLFGAEESAILEAMLLGESGSLSPDLKEMYRRMGIAHILAISGLHVSVLGSGLFALLKKLGLPHRGAALMAALLVTAYAAMIDAGPSTLRAVIMFNVSMGAVVFCRSYDMPSAMALAALIIFIRRPLMLFQPGIQFSFGAVLSLDLLTPVMEGLLKKLPALDPDRQEKKKRLKMRKHLRSMASVLAVSLGTLPLSAWYYGQIPIWSLICNLLILPGMSLLVPLAMSSAAFGLLFMPAALFLSGSVHCLLLFQRLILALSKWLPLTVLVTGRPPVFVMILYYGALGTVTGLSVMKKRPAGRWALLLSLCLLLLVPWHSFRPEIVFLDVGQGDGIFMRSDTGRTYLVDGGSTDVNELGRYRLIPFLDQEGVARLDYALVSHGDEDHISGVRELLEKDRIRHLILTRAGQGDEALDALAALAARHRCQVSYIEAGDAMEDGSWRLGCLYPEAEASSEDRNDLSMVLKVRAGKVSFLMTGDISSAVEAKLPARQIRDLDVLKAAHHGSRYASSEAFLKTASPKMAVISCGTRNRYGHPAPETVDRLKACGAILYETTTDGAVIFDLRGGHLRAPSVYCKIAESE